MGEQKLKIFRVTVVGLSKITHISLYVKKYIEYVRGVQDVLNLRNLGTKEKIRVSKK